MPTASSGLQSVASERAAADRVRGVLAAAYGGDWSPSTERRLLAAAARNDHAAEVY